MGLLAGCRRDYHQLSNACPFCKRLVHQTVWMELDVVELLPPILSVVIPMFDEAGNVLPLIEEITTVLRAYPPVSDNFEIVCVDDGSHDSTASEIKHAQHTNAHVRLVQHAQRLGMSAALRNGIRRARAGWIMTIDGDRQND